MFYFLFFLFFQINDYYYSEAQTPQVVVERGYLKIEIEREKVQFPARGRKQSDSIAL